MMPSDSCRTRRRLAAALAAALVLAGAGPLAGRAAVSDPEPVEPLAGEAARLVKLQRLLAELELYGGPLDGRPSAALSAALLAFQQRAALPPDGAPSDAVFDQLEAAVRLQRLTRFLDTLGREQSREAREALLSQPATRDLVTPPDGTAGGPDSQAAPRAGAVFACLRAPSPDCLIAAAVEASQAIDEVKLRDWALSEIVKAQARAGAGESARATIRRIADARQIIVSLRDLASVQAERREVDAALATASSIPDGLPRIEAWIAIAARQLEAGRPDGARAALDLADARVDALGEPLQRAAVRARLASLRAKAGDAAGADAALAAATRDAHRLPSRDGRATGLGFVATALAEIGRPAEAVRLITDNRIADEAPAALAAAAVAAAQARDPDEAERVAALIGEPRFRAVALVQVAAIEARQGDAARAAARLAAARQVADGIDEALWRDYPLARIAQAYVDLKQPAAAAAAARAIAEPGQRARLLFVIAHLEAAEGVAAAADTAADAERAVAQMPGALDQCWVLTEVALAFGTAADADAAHTMLKRAVEIAAAIQEPASRARAFSRVATVMLDL
jgi:hypothetical protein